ncbi:MAG: hypothetical protein BGO37_08050 [Cellulomonas sp. 73-92]|nr:MAG: hypothetical protein BGO37_08050 [Cellulomonas sp. 73-92]
MLKQHQASLHEEPGISEAFEGRCTGRHGFVDSTHHLESVDELVCRGDVIRSKGSNDREGFFRLPAEACHGMSKPLRVLGEHSALHKRVEPMTCVHPEVRETEHCLEQCLPILAGHRAFDFIAPQRCELRLAQLEQAKANLDDAVG